MISRRKEFYPIADPLRGYLSEFGRNSDIPLVYDDLLRFTGSIPYENPEGEETLWLEVMYPPEVMAELRPRLTMIYATLKIGGDLSLAEHLTVERIDFGEFGNSRPFRIRITNLFNGNSDYYYVKHAMRVPSRLLLFSSFNILLGATSSTATPSSKSTSPESRETCSFATTSNKKT